MVGGAQFFWCIPIQPRMDDTSLGLGFSSSLRLLFVVCVFPPCLMCSLARVELGWQRFVPVVGRIASTQIAEVGAA